jgi:putative membrane protein
MRRHTTHALLVGLAAVAAMASLNASAQSSSARSSAATSSNDSKFLQDAIRGNAAEVQMGELAKQRAESKAVRDYGQMLIDDHSKANEKATKIAAQMNITAAAEPSAKQQQEHAAMAKLSGTEFDTTFMSHMVQGHQQALAEYTAQAQSGNSSKVTDYAKDTLPTLKEHLSKAQSVESKLSDRSSSSSSDNAGGRSGSATSPAPRSVEPSRPSGSSSGSAGTSSDDGGPTPRRNP